MMHRAIAAFVVTTLALFAAPSVAHKAGDSYLTLQINGESLAGQWDVALRDLDLALNLDRNANATIDWGEVRTRHAEIADYTLRRLELKRGSVPCTLRAVEHLIDEHSDGTYAVMKLAGTCPTTSGQISVNYSLLFDIDAQHRGLLKLTSGDSDSVVTSAVFPAENRVQTFSSGAGGGAAQFLTYVADGVKHIAIGLDHILFLIALLLPAVLVRTGKTWTPVTDLRSAFWNVFKVVTAFTIAHSITLSLAALNILQLPSRWVESIIAISVLLTAIDNIWPFLPKQRWRVAFVFGLIHGFGFASVLIDLGLPASALVGSLLGFNLGVEIGQLVLVIVLVPLAYLSRRSWGYSRIALGGGSIAIAAISLGWCIERSFNVQLMPF
ncbi:MAG: HupE/UreJ family protein [Casimicrobium sp.]